MQVVKNIAKAAPTDDLRISAVRALIAPQLLLEELPAEARALDTVKAARQAVHRVLHGGDDRLLVVVGPCSIHDYDTALVYAAQKEVHHGVAADEREHEHHRVADDGLGRAGVVHQAEDRALRDAAFRPEVGRDAGLGDTKDLVRRPLLGRGGLPAAAGGWGRRRRYTSDSDHETRQ